jgi:hypothetical protein
MNSDSGCSGYNYCFGSPGIANLASVGTGNLNDAFSSVYCS